MKLFTKRPPYKYRIHYLLNKLPKEDYDIAMIWFPARLGIHYKTWQSWIYIRQDQPQEIPATAFFTMSLFFNVNPAELFTNPLEALSIAQSYSAFKRGYQDEMTKDELLSLMKLQRESKELEQEVEAKIERKERELLQINQLIEIEHEND